MSNDNAIKNIQETSTEDGLKTEEVNNRLSDHGYNEVPEKKTKFC